MTPLSLTLFGQFECRTKDGDALTFPVPSMLFVDTKSDRDRTWTNLEHYRLARLRDTGPQYDRYRDNLLFLRHDKLDTVKWP